MHVLEKFVSKNFPAEKAAPLLHEEEVVRYHLVQKYDACFEIQRKWPNREAGGLKLILTQTTPPSLISRYAKALRAILPDWAFTVSNHTGDDYNA